MQRAGKPVHINDTLLTSDGVLPTKYFISRRNTLRTFTAGTPPTDQVHTDARTQDLFGPNWSTGGGEVSPHVTATGPTVSGTTGVTWNDGGGQIDSTNGVITGNAGPGSRTRSFTIKNTGTESQDTIQVSFDNGTNYFTLAPGENFSGEISIHYFLVKRTATIAASGLFEALAILA